ncbi:MAG: protein-L-isoaspartate(D-aspartate) O-methyltransferase [Abditibacteriales bacterium]|nr:protein-L-isoaspartate(D-aspartate) O-methyltransferase [Abditibacteriales bacterium]MDW8364448.1 protein-L-isoaspartate(D-aspartate) O-methyltransferase [Abditibacteriales bacterium]
MDFFPDSALNKGDVHFPTAARDVEAMIVTQILARGIKDQRVIAALRKVPRQEFVPAELRDRAYDDTPLPIGEGQTISQPYIVAFMSEQLHLNPTDRVLEIGTGCGYQTAILAELAAEVYSVEIISALAQRAWRTLERLGYRNVHLRRGDGYNGWAEHAPYDAIIVTCAPPYIPPPLIEQLREGGSMAIPLGNRLSQQLHLLRKVEGKLRRLATMPVLFVPMTGTAEEGNVIRDA